MINVPIFSLPAIAALTVQDTMVSAPVVIPPVATMNENEEPALQDSIEPIATYEGGATTASNSRCAKYGGPSKVSKS